MDPTSFAAAEDLLGRADAMLVVGSSLVVYPAAGFPEAAAAAGLTLAIVNGEPTPYDHLADVVVHGRAGEVLPPAVTAALG